MITLKVTSQVAIQLLPDGTAFYFMAKKRKNGRYHASPRAFQWRLSEGKLEERVGSGWKSLGPRIQACYEQWINSEILS